MEERKRVRTTRTSNYGSTTQTFEPDYFVNPDVERAPLLTDAMYFPVASTASAAMNPALAPAFNPAPLTNPAISFDSPTAPLPDWVSIPGYESMGDDAGKLLPPPDLGPIPGAVPTPINTDWTIPFISEDTARKALLDYAKGKCCYGTNPAKEMDFSELRPYNTYRYRLETFTESRNCQWATKPYTGQSIDPSGFGSPPQPWDIPIQVPVMFKDNKRSMPVPRTSTVKPCAQCLGFAERCVRNVTEVDGCWVCSGKGRQINDLCNHCNGQGTECCKDCHGTLYQKCSGCSGQGQILNYIELTVAWKNNIYEFIVEHNSEFPTELFKKVNGEKVFTDEQIRLPPLVNFPAPSINQASQNALQQHHSQFSSSSKILRQRHTIEWLPLTKVEYIWRGKPYDYFVYGKENKIYTDNYPQKCCCLIL